eukprot:TRINITY_DN4268_c0_g3_i1.p1 TRINITY_DN4268_c0_g3~~TRINITY_DN4268_c0_g3_i1.p1  ORF type:complete len:145 (-),score=12.09 TRINITY_DN4268_c0_g3_i1:428-862(-)
MLSARPLRQDLEVLRVDLLRILRILASKPSKDFWQTRASKALSPTAWKIIAALYESHEEAESFTEARADDAEGDLQLIYDYFKYFTTNTLCRPYVTENLAARSVGGGPVQSIRPDATSTPGADVGAASPGRGGMRSRNRQRQPP